MRNRSHVNGVPQASVLAFLVLSMLVAACSSSRGGRALTSTLTSPLEVTLVQLEALDYLEWGHDPDSAPPKLDGRFEVIVGIRNTTTNEVLLDARLLSEHSLLQCFDRDGEFVQLSVGEPWGPFDAERHVVRLAAGEAMWLRRDLGALIWIPDVDDASPMYVKAQYGPRRGDTPDTAFPGCASSALQRVVIPR